MLCLDNDIFRQYTTEPPEPAVVEYLADHHDEAWVLPAVVLFEWLQVYKSHSEIQARRRDVEQLVTEVVPLDADVAEEAANLQARLASAGTSLDLADLLVAASARQAGATLVTGNIRDFDKRPVHELLDVEFVETA